MGKAQFRLASIVFFCLFNQATFGAGLTSFVGVGVGNTYTSFDSPSGQVNSSSTGYHFIAGSQINPMFAVEAEYVDLGEYSAATYTVGAKGLGISGLLTLPVSGMFSVYGKAGLTRLETTVTQTTGTVSTPLSDTVVGISLGYGIQADVAPNVSLFLCWDRYKSSALAGPFTDRINMNSSGLLVYRF